MFRKMLDKAEAGDQLGALIRGAKKEELKRGMVLCKPGTITMHNHFKSQVGSAFIFTFTSSSFATFVGPLENKPFDSYLCSCISNLSQQAEN